MQLLIIEDDPVVGRALRQGFGEADLSCEWVRDGEDGLELARRQPFDAIILDLLLPKRNGLEVLHAIRAAGLRMPVVLLTALGSVHECGTDLTAEANEYLLVKPFAFSELLARVKAVCRRGTTRPAPTLEVADLTLNLAARRVMRGGVEIFLSPTEFRILELLMRHAGQVVTRKMLCEHVWETDWEGTANVMEMHIDRLRGKLDGDWRTSAIRTVRGLGYAIRTT
ncbi:MAG TPA: response regulator transcription factor [Gemmataceae bacterium]|jgi:two-component system OmpR family response regulator/two-component system copper resistance phosphate regulon response regulator CusR